ncbi:transporter substrate-binding domain-containing protein [Catenovulum sp. SM1970]|uniref:transporter substrate-binding domain-containing protein n=1 Tax=Marinifaba aquimaris TaxID=2741323 RepID=UPI00157461B0|nr:transporter substrate-binding domain-containing protein [Marinifaba aquimaris]NTS78721.1 transporter substrate-binding domain-containing protein [Marinifaba aquimaris]
MHYYFTRLLYLAVLYSASPTVHSSDNNLPNQVKIVSADFAPYFIYQDDMSRGLFNEIIVQTLNALQIEVTEIKPMNNEAISRVMNANKADIAINYIGRVPKYMTTSKHRINFYNRLLIKDKSIAKRIKSWHDVKDFKIVSFHGATKVFSEQYEFAMEKNEYYELNDQIATNRVFHKNKVDIKVGDLLMYLWYQAQKFKQNPENKPEIYTVDLLDYNGGKVVFRSERLQQAFDEAMRHNLKNGKVKSLSEAWLKRMNLPLIEHEFITEI